MHIRYFGKPYDLLGYSLSMAVTPFGTRGVPHADCVTGRAFTFRCPVNNPRLWLTPHVSAWDGLLLALQALGSRFDNVRFHSSEPDEMTWATKLATTWLRDGRVLIGPIDTYTLWQTLESRFQTGNGHFLMLLGRGAGGRFYAHDPEGCPFTQVTVERLTASLSACVESGGIIRVLSTPQRSLSAILRSAYRNCQHVFSDANASRESGAKALRHLAQRIEGDALSSFDSNALHQGLGRLSLSRHFLTLLLFDLGRTEKHKPNPEVYACLDRLSAICTLCLDDLRKRDHHRLVSNLLLLSAQEEVLEEFFTHGVP